MRYRKLINGNQALSEIGLGCASYWGKKYFSAVKATNVVHCAIDAGINYFDTGHSYSGGHAELRLGKALQGKTQSNSLVVSSKVGTRVGSYGRLYKDFSPSWIRQSCELSLQQLKLDQLPVFFLHGPNPDDFNDEVFAVLDELKWAGKVGMVGVNAFVDDIIDLAIDSQQFQCVMLDYNILKPQRSLTIEQLRSNGLDVLVAGAIAGGLYDKRFKTFKGLKSIWYWLRAWKNNQQLLKDAQQFKFLNNQQPVTAVQLALAYVLINQKFSSALVGTTSPAHLTELIAASELSIDAGLLSQIKQAQAAL